MYSEVGSSMSKLHSLKNCWETSFHHTGKQPGPVSAVPEGKL